MVISLFCGRGFGLRLFAIAAIKSIDATRSVNQFLLARKERMAGRTNFHV